MSDKIAEIRKRTTFANENKSVISPTGFSWTIPGWQAHNDRAALLAEVDRQRAEIERLRAALKPFAAFSLWPDDIGDEWTVNDIRSGYDWDETENDTKTDDVFIKRGHIRAARKALESKP